MDSNAQQILGAFEGEIQPVRVSIIYRFGLFLVALVMVLLPLIYVGMIALAGYGIHYHATVNKTFLKGDGGLVSMFLYFAPLVAGAILIVFMIKPLFARSADKAASCAVHRNREPVLWAFVEKICAVVGAPVPTRIHVDCDVNASAGFRRGALSLFGNDLVLTIGLPLVVGLNMRQLAGVLAHEFGHFSQGTGMRVTYVVRGINAWFARVVYQRDMLDVKLERWSRNIDFRLAAVLLTARLFIWVTRRVLWLLMMLGHTISCFMLRQMEYDADRYEARVAGSDNFAATARRLTELGAATEDAFASLQNAWRDGRLADDLPRLIHSRVSRMTKDQRAAIEQHMRDTTTGLFDTHPADRDRIASINKEAAAGIFHHDPSATALFRDFEELSKAVTRSYYRQMLGPGTDLPKLVPVAAVEEGQARIEAGSKAIDRFFRGVLLENRALRLTTEAAKLARNPNETLAQLKQARKQMDEGQRDARRTLRRRQQLAEKAVLANQAVTLLDAGFSVSAGDFDLPAADLPAAQRAAGEKRSESYSLEDELEPYFTAAEERMHAALSLLPHPKLAKRIKDHAKLVEETPRLVTALFGLAPALEDAADLRRDLTALATLLSNFEGNEDNAEYQHSLQRASEQAVGRLGKLAAALEPEPYPFHNEGGERTAGEYVLGGDVVDENDLGQVYNAVGEALERLDALYLRVLGRLVHTAGRVEKVCGVTTASRK